MSGGIAGRIESLLDAIASLSPPSAALLLTITEAVGDYNAKKGNLILSLIPYHLLGAELFITLQKNPLALTNAYWDAFSNIMTFGIGYALGERYSTMQYSGMVLISAGIMMLAMK